MADFVAIDSRILEHSNPEELIEKTFAQLEKDASMVSLPIAFEPESDLDSRVKCVENWIRRIVQDQPHAQAGLFYRIDLDQRKAARIIAESVDGQAFQRLAHLILQREFTKVILRQKFS